MPYVDAFFDRDADIIRAVERKDGKRLVLIEGLHRLEACRALGEETVLGIIVRARLH